MTKYILLAVIGLTLTACGSNQIRMTNLERVPAAEANLKTDKDKDGMVNYQLDVKHLAPADKVSEGASAYVAWIEPDGPGESAPQNIGLVNVNENLSATIEGRTPFQNFDFFITAEPHASVTQPDGERIFETRVDVQ